jgi:hypothetical protein
MKRLVCIIILCVNKLLIAEIAPILTPTGPVATSTPAPTPEPIVQAHELTPPATPTNQTLATSTPTSGPTTPSPFITDPQSLSIATLLGLNLQYYYNNRFDKVIAMGTDPEKRIPAFEQEILSNFKSILQLFEKAKAQSIFSHLLETRKFGDRAIDTLKLSVDILDAKASSADKQVEAYSTLLKSFMEIFAKYKEFSIDLRAEKSLFMNTITDFVNTIAKEASPETLQNLKSFLLQAPNEAFKETTEGKKEGPFGEKDREKFSAWLPKIEDAIREAEKKRALSILGDQAPKPQANLSFRNFRTRRLSSSRSLRPSSICMR